MKAEATENAFEEIIRTNHNLNLLLDELVFPANLKWYLVAGCVNQTIFNYLTDKPITFGIKDYDVAYWDEDISKEKELYVQNLIANKFPQMAESLEIINEARVHTWIKEDFGFDIEQYRDIEHAISTWPATVTCIGISNHNNSIKIFAPYGIEDIFNLTIRPNPNGIQGVEVFEKKLTKWKNNWPELTFLT